MIFPPWLKVFGDQKYRSPAASLPSETAEQITFFNTLRREYPEIARIAMHVRNEGKKTFQQVAREKAEGMITGAADIVIPGAPAFVCELKKRDHTKSRWQPLQQEFLLAAQEQGAFVCIALGHTAAMEAVKEWIVTRTI